MIVNFLQAVLPFVLVLAPLVFIPGEGTELYRGVGAIVLFGLAGAAIVTLSFLPAATIMVLSWTRRDPAPDGDIDLRSSGLRPAAPNPQAPNRDI